MKILERIFDKLDKVENEIIQTRLIQTKIQHDLCRNTNDIERHIKRTDLLEEVICKHREDAAKHVSPLTLKSFSITTVKISAALTGIGALFLTIYKIWSIING